MSWQHFLNFLPLPHWQGSFGFCLLLIQGVSSAVREPGRPGCRAPECRGSRCGVAHFLDEGGGKTPRRVFGTDT